MFPVWRQRGELEQLDAFLRTALRSAPPHAATTSAMALIHAELGELETAAAMVEQLAAPGFRKFRHDMLLLPGLAFLTLVCAKLGDPTHAEEIYDLMRPYARPCRHRRCARRRRAGGRSTTISACSPALGDRPEWATDHFEAALAAGARLGTPALLAETRLEFGKCSGRRARRESGPGAQRSSTRRCERRQRSACSNCSIGSTAHHRPGSGPSPTQSGRATGDDRR